MTYSYFSGQNAIRPAPARQSPAPASLSPQYQYVFSPLGAKTPLLRDTYSGSSIVPNDRLYYLTDANTNVTAVVGLSGSTWAVQERYVYDPYGAVTVYSPDWLTTRTSSVANINNTLLYASMVLDPVTGLYYDEARWYSTAVSTFISRDPAQSTSNLYAYCGDEATEATDPTGKNIYLKQGNDTGNWANDTFHRQICVDTWRKEYDRVAMKMCWKRTGNKSYSFGTDFVKKHFPSSTKWLGWVLET